MSQPGPSPPDPDPHPSAPPPDALSALETLRLGAAHAYYSVSRALRLHKVAALLQRAELAVDTPVALLGATYDPRGDGDALARLVHHFHSTPWMTYRSDFPPLPAGPDAALRSDAGWGCTLRSVQMAAAQALARRHLGAGWRWPLGEEGAAPPLGLAPLLRLFWDTPASPLSLHSLCRHGAACGVFPGRWLGPWTGCRALEAAAAAAPPGALGLRVAVVGGAGGGAPVLRPARCMHMFQENGAPGAENGGSQDAAPPEGLLLLVPLVLGLGRINPVYFPALRAVLAMPQCVGLVGGRPGSSLYAVGCQGDALLFLDPHTVQPAAAGDADWASFACDVLRTVALPSLDPSLALALYAGDEAEAGDLWRRLAALEAAAGGAPLVCVREGEESEGGEGEGGAEQSWEGDELSSLSGGEGGGGSEGEGGEEAGRAADEGGTEAESEFTEVEAAEAGAGGAGAAAPGGDGGGAEEGDGGKEEVWRRVAELRQESSTRSAAWELI